MKSKNVPFGAVFVGLLVALVVSISLVPHKEIPRRTPIQTIAARA